MLDEEFETLDESIRGGFTEPILMQQRESPEGTGLANLTVTGVILAALHEVVFVLKVSRLFLVVKQKGSSQLQRSCQKISGNSIAALPIKTHVGNDRVGLLALGDTVSCAARQQEQGVNQEECSAAGRAASDRHWHD